MYRPLPSSLSIQKSTIEGLGLFAVENIPAETNLGITHIEIYGDIIRTPLGGFYNHSDNPNCKKIYKELGINGVYPIPYKQTFLVTLNNILKGEEITVKYTLYKIGDKDAQ